MAFRRTLAEYADDEIGDTREPCTLCGRRRPSLTCFACAFTRGRDLMVTQHRTVNEPLAAYQNGGMFGGTVNIQLYPTYATTTGTSSQTASRTTTASGTISIPYYELK